MRIYEELFIIKPDAPEEEADAFIGHIKDLITGAGGTIDKEEKWGTRRLAYRVMKYSEGNYVLLQFQGGPDLVAEIERRMRVSDLVIKYITVRTDERMKKIEKRRKHREKRAARKPPPAAPAAMPSEPASPTPGAPAAATPAAPAVPAAPAAPAAPVAVEEPVAEGSGE